jgi:hypothetical protein
VNNTGSGKADGDADSVEPNVAPRDEEETFDRIPIFFGVLSGIGSVTSSPGGKPSVSGVGENKTITCNDSFVSVSGVSNTVTITGHCVSVTVSGMKNLVTLDVADTISASGFDNQVTFHSGSPEISNSGGSNVVQQG